eukprot:5237542-Alexandrium_andersonii.AAC.1
MSANSASPELITLVFCAVGQRLTVCAPRAQTPPTCGSPSAKAPSKVSVHKGTNSHSLISPREVMDRPGLKDQ